MRKFIKMPHGRSQELEQLFKCTAPTVRAALGFKSHTALAVKIRKAAVEMGGIEYNVK